MSSSLDLPRPGKAALPYAALAIAALALDVDPRLPWLAGVAGALLFATAGSVRTLRARHELIAVRRTADRLIVHNPISRDASDLVRWRCNELTTRAKRESLRRDIEPRAALARSRTAAFRVAAQASGRARLQPSSSPPSRPASRTSARSRRGASSSLRGSYATPRARSIRTTPTRCSRPRFGV